MSAIEPSPIDILRVEFGDRGVTVEVYDPALETKYGVQLLSIVLRPEFFEDEIAELRDDIFQLVLRYRELASDAPATRPARLQ